MTIGRECINIQCYDKNACTIAPSGHAGLNHNTPPVATFVQKVPVRNEYSKRSFSKYQYFICIPVPDILK